jgi:GntR family transcriptional regulator, rspAB operon transcriptional repressor
VTAVSVAHDDAGAGRLTAAAYERVRADILRRRYPPGTVLTEGTLAERLGMSKTPIRHALRALHQEGLLELGPRRQMLVCRVPAAQRQELLEVRESLEQLSLMHACRTMSDDDIDYLRTLLRRQRRAAEAGREDEFIDLDEELHVTLAERAGLRLVPRVLRQLRGFVRLMQLNTRRERGYMLRVFAEHERLVEAVEARDEAAAIEALREHLHTSEYVGFIDPPDRPDEPPGALVASSNGDQPTRN